MRRLVIAGAASAALALGVAACEGEGACAQVSFNPTNPTYHLPTNPGNPMNYAPGMPYGPELEDCS